MSKMIIVSTIYMNISYHTNTILSHPSQYQIYLIHYEYNKISAEQYTNEKQSAQSADTPLVLYILTI